MTLHKIPWDFHKFSRFREFPEYSRFVATLGWLAQSHAAVLYPHLIYSFLDPSESTSQTASGSVQPSLQGSQLLQTDRQTNRPRYSISSSRLHLVTAVKRPTQLSMWDAVPSVLWCCWLGGRKGIRPLKNGGWWRWALVSPDGVVPTAQPDGWCVCLC